MKLVLISKYFAPDDSVDAISSAQLLSAIQEHNPAIEIHVVTSNNNYKNSKYDQTGLLKHQDALYKTHTVNSTYKGSNKVLQLLGMIVDGWKMVMKAKSLKIEKIISLTNPPLIAFWCALLLRNKQWGYWSFDLYPDALMASKIISGKNPLYKILDYVVYKFPPSFLVCLGEQQRHYLLKKYNKTVSNVILPCGIIAAENLPDDQPFWYQNNMKYIGYLGNVGKAHSKEYIIEVINNLGLLKNFNLILAIYGEHKHDIENYVKINNFDNIILLDKVERIHLSLIDIHLVSLLPEWTHISVPSKAVSAVCSGSALMFYGSTESDSWNMFKNCSFLVRNLNEIPSILSSINEHDLHNKKINSRHIAKNLLKQEKYAFGQISEFVTTENI